MYDFSIYIKKTTETCSHLISKKKKKQKTQNKEETDLFTWLKLKSIVLEIKNRKH